jgi:hypothetical protein
VERRAVLRNERVAPDPAFDPARRRLPLCRWILDAANDAVPRRPRRWRRTGSTNTPPPGYRFVWNTFCDWFLEFAKPVLAEGADPPRRRGARTAAHVLGIDPAPAASGDAVRHRGTVGSFRLRRRIQPDPRALADAGRGADAAAARENWTGWCG